MTPERRGLLADERSVRCPDEVALHDAPGEALRRVPHVHHDAEVLSLAVVPDDLSLQAERFSSGSLHWSVLPLTLQGQKIVVGEVPKPVDLGSDPRSGFFMRKRHASEDRSLGWASVPE